MESTVARLKSKYLEGMTGKKLSVLFEQEISDGVYEGTAENYAKVVMKSNTDISKKLVIMYGWCFFVAPRL